MPTETKLQSVENGLKDMTMQQRFFEYRKDRQNQGIL